VRSCKNCDKEFDSKIKTKIYCNESCRLRAKALRNRNKSNYGVVNCKYCKESFVKKEVSQKYCSSKCAKSKLIGISNQSYFKMIDSQIKAYWLGFLFADGYIDKNNKKLQICLSIKDECLIDSFIEEIGGDKADKRYYGPYKTSGKQVHYCINDEEFVSHLVTLGCVNRKSKKIKFPNIKRDFYYGFLLGFYDGDGTQNTTSLCSSSFDFLEEIKLRFGVKNNISYRRSAYYLSIGVDVYNEMVENLNYGLMRKRGSVYKKKKVIHN
jgi:hypothetical protein